MALILALELAAWVRFAFFRAEELGSFRAGAFQGCALGFVLYFFLP
jgi:hypothetical protein